MRAYRRSADMSVKGEMLNYIVLSLSIAMGAVCAPVFDYPTPNAVEKLAADRVHQARFSLQQHSIKDPEHRQPSAQVNRSWPTINNNSSVSGKPRIRSPYEEFIKDFTFNGSNVDEFMQLAQTMSADRYGPIGLHDKEDSAQDQATRAIDFLDLLKTKKKKIRRWNGRESRRQKREEIVFADGYYPETGEDIVKRVLKQREEEQEENEADDDFSGEGPKPRKDHHVDPGTVISFLSPDISVWPRGILDMKKKLLPMLNKAKSFLDTVTGANTTKNEGKVFAYNLTTLHTQYQLYYACLREKKKFYLQSLGIPMENIQHMIVTSSQLVTLKCHTCLPPLAIAKNYGVRWMRRLLVKGGFDEVPKNEEEEDNFSIDDDGTLYIQGLTIEDAGMYTCFKNSAQEMTYFIGIESAVDRRRVYESGKPHELPAEPEILKDSNLYLFTDWSQWTQCNMCNERGQRKRIGMCMVKKYVSTAPVRPREAQVLVRYPQGVPCRSAILPPFISEVAMVRLSEFMIGYCFMECTTLQPVTTITDMLGKVVEIVLTGKGRISMRGTPPPLPKEIVRLTRYVDSGNRITLECPTDEERDNANKPIRWQNGSQILDEITLQHESGGRVFIDYNNKLIIKSATKYDRSVFSCWINLVRVAIIRVNVAAPVDVTVLSVCSGFCFVFFVLMMIYLGVHLVKFSSLRPVDKKVFRRHANLGKKKRKKKRR